MADADLWVDVALPGGSKFQALYVPARGTPKGAVLLIQEIFGVNAAMRKKAAIYADAGFHVLVPDLFWRFAPHIELNPAEPAQREQAMQYNGTFDDAAALGDLEAAADALRKLASVKAVASVGYCLGGRLSFAAGHKGIVAKAVAYYGVALDRYFAGTHASPTLVHVAQGDTLCPPPAQAAIAERAKANPNIQVMSHAGVGHAFARPGPTYVQAAAEAAQARTLAFLAR